MKRLRTYEITLIALLSAVMCIVGPVSLRVATVPVSVMTFVIFTTLYILGRAKTLWCITIYILLGFAGLPVFAGYMGGLGVLVGPTGGFIIGYIPMIIFAGIFSDMAKGQKGLIIAIYMVANVILYLIGTLWYMFVADVSVVEAFTICIAPFVVFDIIKNVAAVIIGAKSRKKLLEAGIKVNNK